MAWAAAERAGDQPNEPDNDGTAPAIAIDPGPGQATESIYDAGLKPP